MKFSVIIPTHDRSQLLSVVAAHAMQINHGDFEVIISDNSSTAEHRDLNLRAVHKYLDHPNFRIVYPPQLLSPPEHFEFALDFATGDYVAYFTDKMVPLPGILSDAESAIEKTQADIVNWGYAAYVLDDVKNPAGPGTLVEEIVFLRERQELYDPELALSMKASGETPRNRQQSSDYVKGKIVFGCYSMALIKRIRAQSGAVFIGATHDYSAMIQALSLAKTCVMLQKRGFLFLSLPRDQSLGSLTDTDSQAGLRYFRSFSNAGNVLSALLVPGVYASQHNMVAHDYKKFLPLNNKEHLFKLTNWLLAIQNDLMSESKIWSSEAEKCSQVNLFLDYAGKTGQKTKIQALELKNQRRNWMHNMKRRVVRRLKFGSSPAVEITHQTHVFDSLQGALRYVQEHAQK